MLKLKRPQLSVVISVYNEIKTIEKLLRELKTSGIDLEILVVENKSTDGTRELLKQLQPELKLKLILRAENRGVGSAYKIAVAHAMGDLIIFIDPKISPNLESIRQLLDEASKNQADIVSGKVTGMHQLKQKLTNILLKLFSNQTLIEPLAFKIMRSNKYKLLQMEFEDETYLIEWQLRAQDKGFTQEIIQDTINLPPYSVSLFNIPKTIQLRHEKST